MGSILAKSYHSGQAGHNGGGGRLRGVGKRQTSKDLISGVEDLKIRGAEDLKIRGVEDINEDALSLFTLLDPRYPLF